MNNNNRDNIENNEENIEEMPEVKLDQEDKLRVIKGVILIFLFSSVGKNYH
jgi:hypothetical protein